MSAPELVAGERADLLQSLARQRHFLRYTTRGLTDEQAAQRTTASGLCLGGRIKHVALTEQQWMRFIVDGPAAMSWDEGSATCLIRPPRHNPLAVVRCAACSSVRPRVV